ncbi:MAG: FecR domain-containing protein [Bacteroidota bacterium]
MNYPDDTFLARWLGGELSPDEKAAFEASSDYLALRWLIEATAQYQKPALPPETLSQIKERLGQATRSTSPPSKIRRLKWQTWLAAASVVILLVGVWWWTQLGTQGTGPQTLATGTGQRDSLILTDGSRLVLGGSSELSYQAAEEGDRLLKLTGEAWLRITPGPPFTVETEQGRVEVLGTAFSVHARPGVYRVICYEGKVGVELEVNEETFTLQPGEGVYLDRERGIRFEEAAPSPVWLRGSHNFTHASLGEVVAAIEAEYGLQVKLENLSPYFSITSLGMPHGNIDAAMMNLELYFEVEKTEQILILRPKSP